jgi:prepilin-type N-terminal cleavage/methylation domain-containing protein
MYAKQKQQNGFTLIELMIVAAIVGILSVMMLVSLRDSREKKAVEVAGRQVAAVMRATQNYAVSGRIEDADRIPCTFQFIVDSSQTYRVIYTYHAPQSTSCSGSDEIATYYVEDGVSVSPNQTITFAMPHGSTSSAHVVRVQKGSAVQNICIDASGRVHEGC